MMFGSTNTFGQSSNSQLEWQSDFGQTNPFAQPSFGSSNIFGSQTRGSIYGETLTRVFAAAQPSLFFSLTTFVASSSHAFCSSMSGFGSSSTSAFGSSSSFGGSSVCGQNPAFDFGSTPIQSSPFRSTTQCAFGSSIRIGSTQSALVSSIPSFGATSTLVFGTTSTPAFGATGIPAFGSTGTPDFGSTGTAFGGSNNPFFGTGCAFGASSTPTFGASSIPTFGASTSAFGDSSTPAFGNSAFGAQSSPFGSQSTAPTFGRTCFGQSPFETHGGSRLAPYTPTTEADNGTGTWPARKLGTISAMPVYKNKSHEELRLEDYQLGDKGRKSSAPAFGSTSVGQSTFGSRRRGSRLAPYTPTTEADSESGAQPARKLKSISAMPVYKDKSHEELRWEDYQMGDKTIFVDYSQLL